MSPCIPINSGIVCVSSRYRPGTQPPTGFMEWFDWAKVQHSAGLEQEPCDICGTYNYPQELSPRVYLSKARNANGKAVLIKHRHCLACDLAKLQEARK